MLSALLFASVMIQGSIPPPNPPADAVQTRAEKQHQKDIESDEKMGAKFAEEVEKQEKLSTNKEMNERLQRVGADMAAIAQTTRVDVEWGDKRLNKFKYTFKLLQNPKDHPDEVNAFSLPGGYIYVYEGLMKYIESDDELAGVLGHEISHAEQRHLDKLAHEQSKLQPIALLAVLAAIATGKPDAIGSTIFVGANVLASFTSKWSVNAEQSADYGGFQYLTHSKYNPTAMLTFMERLAQDEHSNAAAQIDWGIYRTHPPSKERADAILADMKRFNIPVQRSAVTTRYRTEVEPGKDQGVEIWFNKRKLYTFGGSDALTRADDAAAKLNAFFDSTPQMFDVSAQGATIVGRRQSLFSASSEDALSGGKSVDELASDAAEAIRGSLFTYAFAIWRE